MKEQQMNWQKSNALMWTNAKREYFDQLISDPHHKMCCYSFTVPASPEGPLVAGTAEEDGAERGAHDEGHLLEPVKPEKY